MFAFRGVFWWWWHGVLFEPWYRLPIPLRVLRAELRDLQFSGCRGNSGFPSQDIWRVGRAPDIWVTFARVDKPREVKRQVSEHLLNLPFAF